MVFSKLPSSASKRFSCYVRFDNKDCQGHYDSLQGPHWVRRIWELCDGSGKSWEKQNVVKFDVCQVKLLLLSWRCPAYFHHRESRLDPKWKCQIDNPEGESTLAD